jgi:small conductance mechanosensitive channel
MGSTLAIGVVGYVVGTWVIHRTVREFEKGVKKREAAALQDGDSPASVATRGGRPPRTIRRVKVIASLSRSIWIFLLVLFVILGLLWSIGVSVAPVLASAGVLSVIVGFGAQSLIKDLLAGLFLITEDQYGIGDLITVGTLTGWVVSVTLRVTQIRDANGMVWFVRNGEILTVGNVSQGYSTALVDLPLAYGVDVTAATAVLTDAVARAGQDPLVAVHLMEPPAVLGIESVTPTAITFRITAKVAPNQQWSVQRAIRAKALVALAEADFPPPIVVATE